MIGLCLLWLVSIMSLRTRVLLELGMLIRVVIVMIVLMRLAEARLMSMFRYLESLLLRFKSCMKRRLLLLRRELMRVVISRIGLFLMDWRVMSMDLR